MRTRVEPHISFIFERNIVYLRPGTPARQQLDRRAFKMKSNLYFDARSAGIRFAGRTFDEWRAAGQDASRSSPTRCS